MFKLLKLTTGYHHLLTKYPLRTKILTSACFAGFGDYICQTYIQGTSQQSYNYRRTALMMTMSICYGTPILHYWYNGVVRIADKLVKNKNYIPLVATAIDEIIFSPVYYAGWLFVIEYLDKRDTEKCVENVRAKWWPALVADWKVWPIATWVNFTYVPPSYRMLFVNFIGAFWSIYMSWLQHGSKGNAQVDSGVNIKDLHHDVSKKDHASLKIQSSGSTLAAMTMATRPMGGVLTSDSNNNKAATNENAGFWKTGMTNWNLKLIRATGVNGGGSQLRTTSGVESNSGKAPSEVQASAGNAR